MGKFRKKPVVIDAIKWTEDNTEEVKKFLGGDYIFHSSEREIIAIKTLEGQLEVSLHDWIIRGTKGEHYSCKPDIFVEIYEPA